MPRVRSAPERAAFLLLAVLQLLTAAAPLLHRHPAPVAGDVVSEAPTRRAADTHPCVACRTLASVHPAPITTTASSLDAAADAAPGVRAAQPVAPEPHSSARARAPPHA